MGRNEWFRPDAGLREYIAQEIAEVGPGGGADLPIADATDVVVDSTTYDNPITGGPDKLNVLVFSENASNAGQVALAWAIEGDAFPRVIFMPDPTDYGVFLFGDGTTDLINGESAEIVVSKQTGGRYQFSIAAGQSFFVGRHDADRGSIISAGLNTQTSFALGLSGAAITSISGGGDPNGTIGGKVNDLYLRAEADATNPWVYRCVTAGAAGVAVWEVLPLIATPDVASGGGFGAGLKAIEYDGAPVAIDGTQQTVPFDTLYEDLGSNAGDTVPLTGPVSDADWTFDTTGVTPLFSGAAWLYLQVKLDAPATFPVKVRFSGVGAGYDNYAWIPIGGDAANVPGPTLSLVAPTQTLQIHVTGNVAETAQISYAAIAVSRG